MTEYVAGFLFNYGMNHVALVRKNRPEWQAGNLNAIGGHVEEGEDAYVAMVREFKEETGVTITTWEHFATVEGDWGKVTFFKATGDLSQVETMEDEEILVMHVDDIRMSPTIPNLHWLLPLARYTHDTYAPVIATEIREGWNG